jgi:CTP synthase
MQCAVIEFARDVCGLEGANSSEFDPETPHPVIDLLPEQHGVVDMGATMRLGSYPAELEEGSRAGDLYGEPVVHERHRHRWEVSPEYHDILREHGMRFSGLSPDGRLVEIIELPEHPYFVATQFHPELKSRPTRPHPLFDGLIVAAARRHRQREQQSPRTAVAPSA